MEVEMAIPPLKFSGNLADRHRALNHSVIVAYTNHVALESIVNIDEHTPYDRLFKIDLASKTRNLDYILQSLKSDDMLYVNRALKSLWLLQDEYSNIINPQYLEETLYPQMHFKSVNKMRKWISKNLKGESRNEIFYIYYKEKDFNKAFNFLKKCNSEYILKQSEDILRQLIPKRLKILSQRNVLVTKMFYHELKNSDYLYGYWYESVMKYFEQLIHIMKMNPDLYLDLIENNLIYTSFTRLSFAASKFIMQNRKHRFLLKPELYTAWFLNTNAIALNLSKDENKELLYKLSRAGYISHWFSYQNVEPFLKQLDIETRNLVKKEIFVSVIKDKIEKWPYSQPEPLKPRYRKDDFYEDHYSIKSYEFRPQRMTSNRRRNCIYSQDPVFLFYPRLKGGGRCMLDTLFNEFRFFSFKKTFTELRKRITKESDSHNRMYMLLVLVSKSAGINENLEKLLTFIVNKHLNETNKFRAAIVRSLVKKAFIWRMTSELWEQLLKYAHGLGLDGNKTDLVCSEGLHCVIIRKALYKEDINTQIQSLFFENFDTMKEYKLNPVEKIQVYEYIKHMLLKSAEEEEKPLSQLQNLLQLLKSFNVKLSHCPETKDIIVKTIKKDPEYFKQILKALHKSKDFQNELFYENFVVIRNKEMYNYALKYDISVLDLDKLDPLPEEKFFKELSVYFSHDLAPKYATVLERMAENNESHKSVIQIARFLAIVSGMGLGKTIEKYKSRDNETAKVFAKALKANYHVARADISNLKWSEIGANAVAYMAFNCKSSDTKEMISKLSKWRTSATIAVRLALRNEPTLIPQILKVISIHGPVKVLPIGVNRLILNNSKIDNIAAWEAIKDLIPKISELNENIRKRLIDEITYDLYGIPDKLKVHYYGTVYNNLKTHFSEETKLWLLAVVVDNNLTELSYIVIDAAQYYYKHQFSNCDVEVMTWFISFALNSVNDENLDFWFDFIFVPIFKFCKKTLKRPNSNNGRFESRNKSSNKVISDILFKILKPLKCNRLFFKTSAGTILILLDRIGDYLKTFLSIGKYFKIYCYLNFTMLYFKSVQQCLKQKPHVFDEDKKNDEGITTLGTVFGKYIASETKQMVDSYFLSIREPFNEYLCDYLNDYFVSYRINVQFVKSIIFSILETDITESYIIAKGLYSKMLRYNDNNKEVFKKLKSCQNMEVLFYLYE